MRTIDKILETISRNQTAASRVVGRIVGFSKSKILVKSSSGTTFLATSPTPGVYKLGQTVVTENKVIISTTSAVQSKETVIKF